MELIYNKT